jgi:hypothetical protein
MNKVKWILGVLMVFFLILATNLIDRTNFRRINDSVEAIYEDRLVAKDILFEISLIIQRKQIAFIKSDTAFFENENLLLNQKKDDFLLSFTKTKLTDEESRFFDFLKEDLESLKASEKLAFQSEDARKQMESIFTIVNEHIHLLSKIQLEEGRREMFISKRVLNSVELFTQIEIYFLIILAVLVQILVIYKPKEN